MQIRQPGRRGRSSTAALAVVASLALVGASTAVAQDVGYRGPSYSGAASQPTGEKPQSKTWVTPDGIWWAVMWNSPGGRYEIHRLDRATHKWTSTGVLVDNRSNSKADAVWDGSRLYIATAGTSTSSTSSAARVLRYTYDASAKRFTVDSGFPVNVTTAGMKAIVIDKDSSVPDGKLWITYTVGGKVYVAHTTTDDRTWVTPYVLPLPGATNLLSEDISAIVAFNGKMGVMWSNQRDSAMYFGIHVDGAPDTQWTANTALKQSEIADDHINLRSLKADDRGQVFAATKTSFNGADEPLMFLNVLGQDNVWRKHVFGTVRDDHTRPLVAIDRTNAQLYMLASSPCCGGGRVYYKKSSLSNILFPSGLGTLFMQDASGRKVNNSTSTKQELTPSSDFVVLASNEDGKYYWHNELEIPGAGPPDTTPPDTTISSGPIGTVNSASATFTFAANEAGSTFECSLDGAPFGACASPKTYDGLTNGTHNLKVRAVDPAGNADPTPASRDWTVDVRSSGLSVPAEADTYVSEVQPTTNFGSGLLLSSDDNSGASDEQAYLRFTVRGVTGRIVGAKVRAYVQGGSTNGPAIFRTGGSWLESAMTWNSRPAPVGFASDDEGALPAESYVEYDVTPLVTGDGTYNFVTIPNSSDGLDLASRENADPARRPTLELTVE